MYSFHHNLRSLCLNRENPPDVLQLLSQAACWQIRVSGGMSHWVCKMSILLLDFVLCECYLGRLYFKVRFHMFCHHLWDKSNIWVQNNAFICIGAGIIPWNATPGKACGSTLGDICNSSDVRSRFYSIHIAVGVCCTGYGTQTIVENNHFNSHFSVLPVLSPVHRSVRWCRSHCDRPGKITFNFLFFSL